MQSDEDENEKEQEPPKHPTENQIITPEPELCNSDPYNTNVNDDTTQNTDLELLKQKQFIEKLQRLSHLKRKSEEFLQKNYFTELLNPEKRHKKQDRPLFTQNNHMPLGMNYDSSKSVYDENPIDITSKYNSHSHRMNNANDSNDSKDQSTPENPLELKTECDDSDIIVTDPAVCSPVKSYDGNRDGKKDLSIPMDYQSPQDSKSSYFLYETMFFYFTNNRQHIFLTFAYIFYHLNIAIRDCVENAITLVFIGFLFSFAKLHLENTMAFST